MIQGITSTVSEVKQITANILRKLFLSHEVELAVNLIPLYEFREDEVLFVFHTTNNMIKTPKGYFRYCWKHEPYSRHKQHMQRYYDSICHMVNNREGGMRIFVDKEMDVWKAHKKGVRYQTYSAGKILAEEAIANLFGVKKILTKTHFCRVRIGNGEILVGTMMSDAGGVDVRYIKNRYKEAITPQLVCDLDNLNIIDAVCYEKDHRPGNYHLLLDNEEKAVSICSFDNDSPWAFSPFGNMRFKSYENSSPIIQEGRINRPSVDEDLALCVLALERTSVNDKLLPYLNTCQIDACWKRIKELQKALDKSRDLFKEREKWDYSIMNDELSGSYGRTYLNILCDLYERINDERICQP